MKFVSRNFGIVPFWFWNGMQNEQEITRQLELAMYGGVRGMALHARKGNQVEYMSKRWLELVRHACSEARRLGLEIWIYDEEGCPSGTVGLRLPARGKKYQQKALTFAYMTAAQAVSAECEYGLKSEESASAWQNGCGKGELVRAFLADDLSKPVYPAELPGDKEVLVFNKVFITDYVDTLNRATLEEFLNMTHRIYYKHLQEFFGNPITTIYTDDLNHLLIYGNNVPFLSYTETLDEVFREQHGYSILDKLPALIENLPGCEKVRIDYRHTVMRMFLDNFVEPMRQWCEHYGLLLTGHLSGDEGTLLKSICRFSAAMPFYEHEDIPGIDDFLTGMADSGYLRRPFNELGFSAIVTCKQVSSAASQLKNGVCSSEVLTSLGWGVPVSRQMAQLRLQQGLGVNVIVPHDFTYSTAGVTKRDHPASFFFQQPWFAENRELHNAIAHSSQLLTRGACAARIAILNPVTSGWVGLDGERLTSGFTCRYPGFLLDTEFVENNFAELSLNLLRNHIDFEYVDEELLAHHGGAEQGSLRMGNCTYETILLPPMTNIQPSSLALLRNFVNGGGKVVATGQMPTLVEGVQQENIFDFPVTISSVANPNCGIHPSLEIVAFDGDATEILLHTRTVDNKFEYFLVNFSALEKTLSLKGVPDGYALYDPQSNRMIAEKGCFPKEFTLSSRSCCHILPEAVINAKCADIAETSFAFNNRLLSLDIEPEITVTPEYDNMFLVDAGFLPDGQNILFSDTTDLTSGSRIVVPVNISDPELVSGIYAETTEMTTLTVNGKKLKWTDERHPATQDLKKASLCDLLKPGCNEFAVKSSGQRIENFYLSGSFGVKLIDDSTCCRAELTSSTSIGLGDASRQGLPFYWGSLRYDLRFTLDEIAENSLLDLGDIAGVVKIEVNGNYIGLKYDAPWRFGLKDMLKLGENHIEIKFYNTAQNFLGPHRKKNILGPRRAREGSSSAAWTPKILGDFPDSWGVASFGLYGPIKLMIL